MSEEAPKRRTFVVTAYQYVEAESAEDAERIAYDIPENYQIESVDEDDRP